MKSTSLGGQLETNFIFVLYCIKTFYLFCYRYVVLYSTVNYTNLMHFCDSFSYVPVIDTTTKVHPTISILTFLFYSFCT